jgi:hypothetical protein
MEFLKKAMEEAIAKSNADKENYTKVVKDIFSAYCELGNPGKMDWEGFTRAAIDLASAVRIETLVEIKKYAESMDAGVTWRKHCEDEDSSEVEETMPDQFATGMYAGNDRIIRRCEKLFPTQSNYAKHL